jgi:hypothetical protein
MIWQASQLEVEKMNAKACHREPELVEVYKKARAATTDVKVLQEFEMRQDFAEKAFETEGCARTRARGAVAPSASTPTRSTRSSARTAKFRILEMWVPLLERYNTLPWFPHENHGIST